jgi:predicted CXXCH cytochrome family protein
MSMIMSFPCRRLWSDRGWNVLSLLFVCLLGLITGVAPEQASAASVEVLIPQTGTIYARNPETHLVLRQTWSLGARKARVLKDDQQLEPIMVIQHQEYDYLHFRLPLKAGTNNFTIDPGGERLELTYSPVHAALHLKSLRKDTYLFHQDDQLPKSCAFCHDLQKATTVEPFGIKKQGSCVTCHRNVIDKASRQHSTTTNRQCLACHQQFVQPWRIGFPTGKLEDTCFTCHTSKEAWRSRKHIHGPMLAGGCTLCHNPHGDDHRYQLWAEGSVALCIACHSDKEELMDKERPVRFVHGIIHGPGCVACHDPHASNHQFLLHKSINDLCVSCHTGLAGVKRGHPVGGHPVSGKTERRRKGRELSCTSCHDPHGSSYRYMLFAESMGGHVCIKCHR